MAADNWLKRSGLWLPMLGFAGNQPYPCDECCIERVEPFDCGYFADIFDRGDSSDLGSDWTEDSGDWSIDTNRLTTADTTAVCVSTTAGALPYVVTARLKGSAGSFARIIVNYTDTSNYTFAQINFEAGFARLTLNVRAGGSDTQLDTKTISVAILPPDAYMEMRVCVKSNHTAVNTKAGGGAWAAGLSEFTPASSQVVGVGTGSDASGVFFDTFTFQKHFEQNESCPSCSVICDRCIDGVTPDLFQVVIAGVAAGDADCPSVNGTWILEARKQACGWISDGADYRIQAATCGDKTCVSLSILSATTICGDDISDNYAIDVQALGCVNPTTDCSAGCGWFRHSQVAKYDCLNISNLSLRVEGTGVCDISGASCTVTAL